jgi:hypothetical protein
MSFGREIALAAGAQLLRFIVATLAIGVAVGIAFGYYLAR